MRPIFIELTYYETKGKFIVNINTISKFDEDSEKEYTTITFNNGEISLVSESYVSIIGLIRDILEYEI